MNAITYLDHSQPVVSLHEFSPASQCSTCGWSVLLLMLGTYAAHTKKKHTDNNQILTSNKYGDLSNTVHMLWAIHLQSLLFFYGVILLLQWDNFPVTNWGCAFSKKAYRNRSEHTDYKSKIYFLHLVEFYIIFPGHHFLLLWDVKHAGSLWDV